MVSTPALATKSYSERLAELDFDPKWTDLPELPDKIDPFNYAQRFAAYKLLIEGTNPNGIFGKENEFNMFWGYVFQLDWQWHSGRLRLTQTPTGRIDSHSMWGYGNYTLCIIPLIAAMQEGLIAEREIVAPYAVGIEAYVTGGGKAGPFKIPLTMTSAVTAWRKFFRILKGSSVGGDLEPLRFELWKAHYASLIIVEEVVRMEGPKAHSQNEVDFLLGWIRMVDFLGSAAWRTDLPFTLENGLEQLPPRLINEQDLLGNSSDFSEIVRINVRSIIGLTRQSVRRFNFNLWLWKRAMRSRQARDEVLPMLDATFNPTPSNAAQRRKLLRYILKV